MRQALSRLHRFIVEDIAPLRPIAFSEAQQQELAERWAGDYQVCVDYLTDRSIALKGREQLFLLVQGYQRSFVPWLDLAYHYQRDYPEHPLQALYLQLSGDLFALVQYLRVCYAAYFNHGGKAAPIFQEQSKARLSRRWDALLPALEQQGVDSTLVAAAFLPVSVFLRGADSDSVTFSRLDWLDALTQCLEEWVQGNYADASEAFLLQLLPLNFNAADFVACCVRYVRAQGQEALAVKERLEGLYRWRQRLHQLGSRKDMAYSAELPPACGLVAAWLEDEIVLVEKLLEEFPSPARPYTDMIEHNTITTVFSVPQLVAWAKGHVDAGVFPEENIEGLCRKLSRVFRTRHREHISPDSLQSKAYNVNEKAKEIVNEFMIKVFNVVKRY